MCMRVYVSFIDGERCLGTAASSGLAVCHVWQEQCWRNCAGDAELSRNCRLLNQRGNGKKQISNLKCNCEKFTLFFSPIFKNIKLVGKVDVIVQYSWAVLRYSEFSVCLYVTAWLRFLVMECVRPVPLTWAVSLCLYSVCTVLSYSLWYAVCCNFTFIHLMAVLHVHVISPVNKFFPPFFWPKSVRVQFQLSSFSLSISFIIHSYFAAASGLTCSVTC